MIITLLGASALTFVAVSIFAYIVGWLPSLGIPPFQQLGFIGIVLVVLASLCMLGAYLLLRRLENFL